MRTAVYVGQTPFDATEAMLREHFSDCGAIELAEVKKDPETGLVLGFGVLMFSNREDAEKAVATKHETMMGGRKILVAIMLPAAKTLPVSSKAYVLRTDFSDDANWEKLCALVLAPQEDFTVNLEFLSDVGYKDRSLETVMYVAEDNPEVPVIFVADQETFESPELPLVVLDPVEGLDFRALPSTIQSIENNLSISNMDFEEFMDARDEDGIFRGFKD